MIATLFSSFIATKLGKLLPPWLWEIVLIALLVGAGALAHHVAVVRHDNGVRAEQKAADQRILDQTIANYRAAAAKAEAEDKANAQRVVAQQQQINKETSDAFQARLNAARADIARLRAQFRPANPGSPAKPDLPAIPTPTCGADSPSLDPATRAFDCAIQLDELIQWVERQHAIDPNK